LGYASGTGTALCRLAQLARERGDDHEAALTYREALQLWAGVQDRWFITLALASLAELASAHGQAESAATLLGSIDALAAATGAPLFYTARINSDSAHIAAQTALGAARFAALRAEGHTLRLDDAVALALTISVPEPSSVTANNLHVRSGAYGLTPREIEVLRLLVAGHTDREIATKLFIGHRTVQDHVSHILGKLGVVNRTEAATVAQRDGLVQP
jgi:non-specific serine/threonine protein kinase